VLTLRLALAQVWSDDAVSLKPPYEMAKELGLGGAGPYRWDQLDYAGNAAEAQEMMDAIKAVLN
jgi:hypothetical protein